MNRRGFLGSILALGAAPAIVRAESIMRIVPASRFGIVVAGSFCGELPYADIDMEIGQWRGIYVVTAPYWPTPLAPMLLGERMRLTRERIAFNVLTGPQCSKAGDAGSKPACARFDSVGDRPVRKALAQLWPEGELNV